MNESKPSADDPAPAPPGELAPAPASGTAVTPAAPPTRPRLRWVLIGLLSLGLIGAGARAVWTHMAARADLARAKAALDADDVKAARDILDRCLLNSPNNAGAHFRMAQAARRAGDVRSAEDHLDRAEALGWDPGAIELERAVARAQ
ncbi:MAG: tetratricopeptide repeat protein, partial [Zavarzinella sp.]|nr:tetratricopeptide repeat protein [Zavarzinella sp.]